MSVNVNCASTKENRTRKTDDTPGEGKYCGRVHEFRKENCPAYGKICDQCGKQNNFARQCLQQSVRTVELEEFEVYTTLKWIQHTLLQTETERLGQLPTVPD